LKPESCATRSSAHPATLALADDAHDQWQVVIDLGAPANSRSGKLDQRGDGREGAG